MQQVQTAGSAEPYGDLSKYFLFTSWCVKTDE